MKLRLPWMSRRKIRSSKLLLVLTVAGVLLLLISFFQMSKRRKSHSIDDQYFMSVSRESKDPDWPVAEALKSAKADGGTPVFIVEEHYEVLKYWFDAADIGVIPKKGNTLIHIDGHSDSAPPFDLEKIPWFRSPHNHSEVAALMQRNDVFIAGAAATGLIDRFIWVWPEWDRENHDANHEVTDIYAGWRTYYPAKGKPFECLCVCRRNASLGIAEEPGDEEWDCVDDEPPKSAMHGGPMIKQEQCRKVLSGRMEEINEKLASELLKKGGWVTEKEQVILDIDEDYYGCESSIVPLLDAGLTQENVADLSALLRGLLCVADVEHEFLADKVFHTVIQIVMDFKAKLCNTTAQYLYDNEENCLFDFEADQALLQLIPEIVESVAKAGMKETLCSEASALVIMQGLLRSLYSYTTSQLKSLVYVGACLETAPTILEFSSESLHVCHGFNVPGPESAVNFHLPSKEENVQRTALLKDILGGLPNQPGIVTVCRSVRDGYTPWRFFSDIEKGISGVLSAVFPGVRKSLFHYDENLLGGKRGWPQRRR